MMFEELDLPEVPNGDKRFPFGFEVFFDLFEYK